MYIAVDQIRRSSRDGNTVAVDLQAITGAPAVNASYPLTNIWSTTSELTKNQATDLTKYTRVDFTESDQFSIRFDLGAAQNVYAGLLSGYYQQKSKSVPVIERVRLQWSDDNSAWTTHADYNSTAAAASTWGDGTLAHYLGKCALIGTAEASHRYWRFLFDTAASPAASNWVKIGYAGLYGDGFALSNNPSARIECYDAISIGKTGAVFRVRNGDAMVWDCSIPQLTGVLTARAWQLLTGRVSYYENSVDHSGDNDFIDPSRWPMFALLDDISDESDADDEAIRRSHFSAMVTIERGSGIGYPILPTSQPSMQMRLREWQ